MNEGKIIKYYREQSGMTQEQLGRGICSTTHISKIELGQTHYSAEIISLVAERLNINIKEEINTFETVKQELDQWLYAMIMERTQEIEAIKSKFETSKVIEISEYHSYYQLLLARYYLLHENNKKACDIIRTIEGCETSLPPYENSLYKHVRGILFLKNQEYQQAIEILKSIDNEMYNNPEYYYHLAIAYDANDAKHMAYSCAQEALQFFKETSNFLRIIDVEMLLLILKSQDKHHDFKDRRRKYEALIQSCELCHTVARKACVLHNLALEYFIMKDYETAGKLYKQSIDLKDKKSGKYLLSLEGYIQSCLRKKRSSLSELLDLAHEGIGIAEDMNAPLYVYLLTLTTFLIKKEHVKYYTYLNDHALPFFKLSGHVYLVKRSAKELFNYYSKIGQFKKAVDLAKPVMNYQN
ncbi:helix-turn-helix domain-containing protein [Halobacillus naozhouensis]|uniref:Helix-turn-helix transcriptional regulator n=1 Tax=Halobacillus naozhouensis TaxID=554880 RepID=A0ABY8J4K3_9BACI|nr:helix-turn-helix transcriptional regulator [Halobacillus naozhouensis]WFT76374.1 helix-turn-helix transcriptional regulator [Halobacillus naozhouensis]